MFIGHVDMIETISIERGEKGALRILDEMARLVSLPSLLQTHRSSKYLQLLSTFVDLQLDIPNTYRGFFPNGIHTDAEQLKDYRGGRKERLLEEADRLLLDEARLRQADNADELGKVDHSIERSKIDIGKAYQNLGFITINRCVVLENSLYEEMLGRVMQLVSDTRGEAMKSVADLVEIDYEPSHKRITLYTHEDLYFPFSDLAEALPGTDIQVEPVGPFIPGRWRDLDDRLPVALMVRKEPSASRACSSL